MSDEQQVDDQSNIQPPTELETAQKEAQANLDGWKRATADFENYKRRKEAENKELVEFAREVTVAKLLPTLDAISQALKHVPVIEGHPQAEHEGDPLLGPEFERKYKNWQMGITGILSQLEKTLAELGVKKIEAVGKKFDPHFHEALREVESEGEEGVVVEEFQTGFELNGKVIRPSQVVISKNSTKGRDNSSHPDKAEG